MINNFLLDVLAAGAILSGILVITSKNPVIAVLFLISAFVNAAGYLLLLGVGFIGISYIIVYIGAIAVLFLFVIMMINIKLSDILDIGSQYTKNLPLALTIGFLFTYEIFTVIPVNYGKISILNLPIELLTYLNGLLYGSTVPAITVVNVSQNPHTWDISSFSFLQVESLGHGLYTYGASLFILCSIILLLAMLAPISIVHFNSSNNQKTNKTLNSSPSSISFNRLRSVKPLQGLNIGNRASYHTSSHSGKLDPWAVTGLVDAEGYFGFTIRNRSERKLAFELQPRFCLHMHAREYDLLVSLKEFFGVGTVTSGGKNAYYTVSSKKDLEIVIQHFKLFPLLTSKKNSFSIFLIVFDMFCQKQHLSVEGFLKAVSYINYLNRPLESETLKSITGIYGELPLLVLPPIVKYSSITIPSPWWVIGFISGDGCFSYIINVNKVSNKQNYSLHLSISQLKMDKYVLISIANFLGAGIVYEYENRPQAEFVISNIKTIQHVLLPFFLLYPLIGHKGVQYNVWLEAVLVLLTLRITKCSKSEAQLLELLKKISSLTGYIRKSPAIS